MEGGKIIRHSDQTARPGDHHFGIAAIVLYPGVALIDAVHEIAIAAVHAVPATATEEAHTDALAHLPALDTFSDGVDPSNRFVTRHSGPLDRQDSFDRRGIRIAYAACLDTKPDMMSWLLRQRVLRQLQP